MNRGERERLISLTLFFLICTIVSIQFIFTGFLLNLYYLANFSIIYTVFFGLSLYGIIAKRFQLSQYASLFVTNFSVFTITLCLGFDCGFYFYLFIPIISVFIVWNNVSKNIQYLVIITYVINAALLYYLNQTGFVYYETIPSTFKEILFIGNFLLTFLFLLLLTRYLLKYAQIRSLETQNLMIEKSELEKKLLSNKLFEFQVKSQLEKLKQDNTNHDVFNHIISHNFRAPINRVQQLIDLLQQTQDFNDDQKELLKHIKSSISDTDELIRDLNYILVQKKLGNETEETFSLKKLFDDITTNYKEQIAKKHAQITMHFEVDMIHAKKSLFQSILTNLISNALKYSSKDRTPQINITTKIQKDFWELSLEDNGIGMDIKNVENKIFTLYARFQLEIEGKGIGLYLVKSHTEMLNGKLQVLSELNKGTRFEIQFPQLYIVSK